MSKKPKIPSIGSWGNNHIKYGFDFEMAFDEFCGVSAEDAKKKFKENSLRFKELLYYMSPIPFDYYCSAYLDYLLSFEAQDDCDGASAFLSDAFAWLKDDELNISSQLQSKILETAKYVSEHQNFFDAYEEVYGNFEKRYHKNLKRFKNRK